METLRLFCGACGQPIMVPSEAEHVVCAACQTTLKVERGEKHVTLRIVEAQPPVPQEKAVSQASGTNRTQLEQMISMEALKINTLQTEIKAALRQVPGDMTTTPALIALVLQECDSRMVIRNLKMKILHMDLGEEESFEAIRQDQQLLQETIKALKPYEKDALVKERITSLNEELNAANARYIALEKTQLAQGLESLTYPDFEDLTLEEMEELQKIIPADLTRLSESDQTEAKAELRKKLHSTLAKINEAYPRRKVESQTGPLPALDIKEPYPKEATALTPLIKMVDEDLSKLANLPESEEKAAFTSRLSKLKSILTSWALTDVPAEKPKKKKKKGWIVVLVVATVLVLCVIAAIIIGVVLYRNGSFDGQTNEIIEQVSELTGENDEATQPVVSETTYQEYSTTFLEVTASITYLRDQPDLNASGSYKVEAGEILEVIPDNSISSPWYKVSTMDGSATGYLASDWAMPFTVSSVRGDLLTQEFESALYSFDWSSYDVEWDESEDDDEYAYSKVSYVDGWYELEVTTNDTFIYFYSNTTLDNLPDQYQFSLTLDPVELDDSVYYGIQTNVVDGANFDAVFISREGYVFLIRVRDGVFSIIYDAEDYPNSWAFVDPLAENTFSVVRLIASGGSKAVYKYAINGYLFATVEEPITGVKGLAMGAIIYMDDEGDHALIRMDNFIVNQ